MPYISPAGSDSLQRFNLLQNVDGPVFYGHFHPLSLSKRLIVGYDSKQLQKYTVCSEDNALRNGSFI